MNTDSVAKKLFSFRTVLVLFIITCLCCGLPAVHELIIALMENLMGRQLRDMRKWHAVITYAMRFFAMLAAFWYFFLYSKKGKQIFADMLSEIKKAFTAPGAGKRLIVLFILYTVCYLALMRSDCDYQDDIRRSLTGHKSWVGSSRYVSEALAVFLHTNFFLNDIAPLTQLISCGILAIASYILVWSMTKGAVTKMALLASTFMGMTPFYFDNMVYKFDSPYMAFSMLMGVAPFLFVKNTAAYVTVSVLSLLLACTSYQAANSVYIVVAMVMALIMYMDGKSWKEIGRFTAWSVGSYILALIFFRMFIMIPTSETIDERSTDIALGMPMLLLIKDNFTSYVHSVLRNYGNIWIRLFTSVAVMLFPVTAGFSGKKSPLCSAGLSLAVLAGMFCLSFGAYLVIGNTVIDNRSFMGFDALIAVVGIFIIMHSATLRKIRYVSSVAVICLFYGFCVSATVSGNMYGKQKDYQEFRYTILMNDLGHVVDGSRQNRIYLRGDIGTTTAAYMEYKNYRCSPDSTSGWTSYLVQDKNMDFEFLAETSYDGELNDRPELWTEIQSLPLLIESYYHTIYGKDGLYYVILKNPQVKEFLIP